MHIVQGTCEEGIVWGSADSVHSKGELSVSEVEKPPLLLCRAFFTLHSTLMNFINDTLDRAPL
jgi:hypothetical protein